MWLGFFGGTDRSGVAGNDVGLMLDMRRAHEEAILPMVGSQKVKLE